MTAVRNVLQQRRPRTTSPLAWWRCVRCNRLTYAAIMGTECDPCVKAAREFWPALGPVCGEVSGT